MKTIKKVEVPVQILMYAFRYALGRHTYSEVQVAEEIIKHLDDFSEMDLVRIYKEIEDIANLEENAENQTRFEDWRKVQDAIKFKLKEVLADMLYNFKDE